VIKAAPKNTGNARVDRGAATRERLLQATVDCLFEKGYVATTTVEVCRRTNAPRGTLLHHFGTKTELVVAAAEYIFELRMSELREALMARPTEERHTATVIDLLWSIISGPTFYAWLELAVAARTDAQLRESLLGMFRRFEPRATQLYFELFPNVVVNNPTELASKDFAFAVLNGLAIDRILKSEREIAPVIDLLKQIATRLDPPA